MLSSPTSSSTPPSAHVAGIILAAGKGTRMRSTTPKVLHKLTGLTMLEWVFRTTKAAGVKDVCVILSEELEGFQDFLKSYPDIAVATQRNRQGTGDAVASAAFAFDGVATPGFAAGRQVQGPKLSATHVLIMAGDVPAVNPLSLKDFIDSSLSAKAPLSVLGMDVLQPQGYGRLVTQGDELQAIVEEKDADEATRRLTLCNTGVIFAEAALLFELLAELTPNNAQREYYLTDSVALCRARGHKVRFHVAPDAESFAGINDRRQLAAVETLLLERKTTALMLGGVTVRQASSCYIDAEVDVGPDSEIAAGAHLLGSTKLGRNCTIGHHAVLTNVTGGDGVTIGAGAVLTNCRLTAGQVVPPLSVMN